ncbi:MAG: biotin--[acetyl-CoA-carboxylase] ligase [Candidatus Fermentibacteraceae bacterium]|nr:biotin--[acetyl-CoA-carboxylase] ligase [Candidatus Fermentibacteraceae bacterium]
MAEPYRLNRWLVYTENSVASTQMWLRDKITELPSRTAIVARVQTSGRGRMGKHWESPSGGLYFSFLLKPSPPAVHASCISLLAALVLTRLLRKQGIQALVKWPNDVIVEGKKIAGLIAEAGSFPESWFVLGIGVNLAEPPFVPDRKFLPAGAWSEFGEPPEAAELLKQFLLEFDSCWEGGDESPIGGVLEELNGVLWRRGKRVFLSGGNEKFSGIVSGIDTDGSLMLLTDSGTERFNSGEVTAVPEERR